MSQLPDVPALPGRPVSITLDGPVADPARAWALIGDTDWLNLVGGNGAVLAQGMHQGDDGLPVMDGALAGPGGLRLEFEEAWTSWVRHRWFRQVRTVDSPLLQATDYQGELLPAQGGVQPRITLTLYGSRLTAPVLGGSLRSIGKRWQDALDALAAPPAPRRQLPPAAREALSRWEQDADPAVVSRMRTHLEQAAPTQLRRMRPFGLAERWGLDPDHVLDALLHGVLAGALELYWSVRCVRCYGQVGGGATLSDLADHAACPSCRVDFDNDLGSNVEVLLTPHPAVVPRVEERFCTMYPAGAPEHLAVFTVGPGQLVQTTLDLPEGALHLGPGGDVADTEVLVGQGDLDHLEWQASNPAERVRLQPGPVDVQVHNDVSGRLRVQLTRDSGQEPRVPATVLTTRPLFRRRFGHQVLAPDLRLSTRAVTVLFTDLSGSTAMYEAVGDARAFAVVRDHFVVLRKEIEATNGVVVKTIGDAIMAAFDTPARALRAALAMHRAFDAWVPTLDLPAPPGLKVGIHVGPALAVHSDLSGLDWFGGTVNLAARAESLASRGDIIMTRAAAGDGEVVVLLEREGLEPEALERTVKGFHGTLRFVRLRPVDG